MSTSLVIPVSIDPNVGVVQPTYSFNSGDFRIDPPWNNFVLPVTPVPSALPPATWPPGGHAEAGMAEMMKMMAAEMNRMMRQIADLTGLQHLAPKDPVQPEPIEGGKRIPIRALSRQHQTIGLRLPADFD